jgi:hypothetical protein
MGGPPDYEADGHATVALASDESGLVHISKDDDEEQDPDRDAGQDRPSSGSLAESIECAS